MGFWAIVDVNLWAILSFSFALVAGACVVFDGAL